MNYWLIRSLLLLLLCGQLSAAPENLQQSLELEEQQMTSVVKLKKPENRLLDKPQYFANIQRQRLVDLLERTATQSQISLYAVILPDLSGEEFPANIARILSSQWLPDDQPAAVLVFLVEEKRFAIGTNALIRQKDTDMIIDQLPGKYETLLKDRTSPSAAVYEAIADFEFTLRQLTLLNHDQDAIQRLLFNFVIAVLSVFGFAVLIVAYQNSTLSLLFIKPVYFDLPPLPTRLGGRNCGGNIVASSYDTTSSNKGSK